MKEEMYTEGSAVEWTARETGETFRSFLTWKGDVLITPLGWQGVSVRSCSSEEAKEFRRLEGLVLVPLSLLTTARMVLRVQGKLDGWAHTLNGALQEVRGYSFNPSEPKQPTPQNTALSEGPH